MCWHGGPMNLEEYRQEVKDIYRLSLEMFEKSQNDEMYEVILEFRDDKDLAGFGIWNKVFNHFDSVKKYIFNQREFMDEEDEEPMVNRAYWSVTKYKLNKGEYEELMTCCFSIGMKLLSVNLNNLLSRSFLDNESYDEISNHNYLLMFPKNIELPYKIGDILKVNAIPFGKDFYVVYGGESAEGEHKQGLQEHYDNFYHRCIYESEDREGLWIDDISDTSFTDYIHFENCPLINCERTDECFDEKIIKASKLLKNRPESWYELVSYAKTSNDGRNNLDKWLFGDE